MNKFIAMGLMLLALGCRDIGRGGTGELVIPQRTLREIEATEPHDFAASQPATAPSTQPSTRPSSQPVADRPMTIEEVRQLALANNLNLRVELFNPSISREGLNQEEARYEALFTAAIDYGSSDGPVANQTAEALNGSQSNFWDFRPGVRLPLRTGGDISLSVPMTRSESNSTSSILNPAYTTDVAATLSQPLLRGAGIDVNAQGIRVAFYAYQQSQAQTKLAMIGVLANADRVYWRLYAARQALLVRRQEYDLAVAQLRRARRQVELGAAAEVEVIRAQSGVADRVETIITADNTVRDSERDLKRIINSPDLDMQSPVALVTATPPRPIYYVVDPDRMISRAMNGRMELIEMAIQLARNDSEVRFARNEMLPLVSLTYTYNINGLGGDFNDAFAMVGDRNFADHRVGLSVEVPIGNEAARSHLRSALLQRLQSLATREQRELQIRQEVLNAVDQLEADWQRILAARQRVIAAARATEAEIRQFEQGLRTSTDVLIAQANLANAKLSEISAVGDYQIAQVDIAFATGSILGASHITWDPPPAPKP